MSEPPAPPLEEWRPLTPPERALVELWLVTWNETTGDNAQLSLGAEARNSCACGRCATFDVRPLDLSAGTTGLKPFHIGGDAVSSADGAPVGLVVFGDGTTTIFEAFPHTDSPVDLVDLEWEFYTTKKPA